MRGVQMNNKLNGKLNRLSLNGKINIVPDKTGGDGGNTNNVPDNAVMICSGIKSDIVGIAETQED